MTTKKKSIYLSILGVGLCVVAYDLISGGDVPAAALGANTPKVDSAATETQRTAGPEGLATLSVPHFPDDFGPTMAGMTPRDVFVPSALVMRELIDPPEPIDSETNEEVAPEDPPEPFSERHSLSAIMSWEGSRSAIIDGKVVREGQSLSDCIVGEIGERNVQFDCQGTPEALWLVDPLLGEPSE